MLFCWFSIIMIINYFAIVNLSAQIENFTTQNTKCLANNLLRIHHIISCVWLTYSNCLLDKNVFTFYFHLMFSANRFKTLYCSNNNPFIANTKYTLLQVLKIPLDIKLVKISSLFSTWNEYYNCTFLFAIIVYDE